jgi:hypothetical protein
LLGAVTVTPANAAGANGTKRHAISQTYFCTQRFSKDIFLAPYPTRSGWGSFSYA